MRTGRIVLVHGDYVIVGSEKKVNESATVSVNAVGFALKLSFRFVARTTVSEICSNGPVKNGF